MEQEENKVKVEHRFTSLEIRLSHLNELFDKIETEIWSKTHRNEDRLSGVEKQVAVAKILPAKIGKIESAISEYKKNTANNLDENKGRVIILEEQIVTAKEAQKQSNINIEKVEEHVEKVELYAESRASDDEKRFDNLEKLTLKNRLYLKIIAWTSGTVIASTIGTLIKLFVM